MASQTSWKPQDCRKRRSWSCKNVARGEDFPCVRQFLYMRILYSWTFLVVDISMEKSQTKFAFVWFVVKKSFRSFTFLFFPPETRKLETASAFETFWNHLKPSETWNLKPTLAFETLWNLLKPSETSWNLKPPETWNLKPHETSWNLKPSETSWNLKLETLWNLILL